MENSHHERKDQVKLMVTPKLAFRNLLGAGLRTWLNVIVLSFAFFTIIALQGLLEGMNRQISQAMLDTWYGGGQYWSERYDPYDPLTLEDAHQPLNDQLQHLIRSGTATPILSVQGSMYPHGRIRPVIINGIVPGQKVLSIPSYFLENQEGDIGALLGQRMAEGSGLTEGDLVTIQWRDANGVYDARDVRIDRIMKTSVQSIDNNQIWIPLQTLQKIAGMPGEATLVIVAKDQHRLPSVTGWNFKDQDFLLQDINALIKSKTVGSSIIYLILLFLAMLAIFDTQVLSIFRRRKEIGTLMALGMTRFNVVKLFTLEGALHGVLAVILMAIYGIPLLSFFAKTGWQLPAKADSYGFSIGEKIFPSFSIGLITGTTLLVFFTTLVVSYLPARRISELKPTEALRGKLR